MFNVIIHLQWDLRIKDQPLILSTIESLSSSLRSKNVLQLWVMIIWGHYKLSFLERLSSSQRVPSSEVPLYLAPFYEATHTIQGATFCLCFLGCYNDIILEISRDHAGGNKEMAEKRPDLTVCGNDDRIDAMNKRVKNNDQFNVSSAIYFSINR